MTTNTDLHRLQQAEVAIASRDAEIRRLTQEVFNLRSQIERLTKEKENA